jgi:hypothetical protein
MGILILGSLNTKAYFGPIMKTLVMHPQDPTISFISKVYTQLANKTVIKGGITKSELRELIECHDRVFCFGHGLP